MISELVNLLGEQRTSYLLIIMSQILFPISFIYVNENKFNSMQTTLVRGCCLWLTSFVCLRYYNMTADYKYAHNFKHMFIRNSMFVVQGIALTVVQFYLPLPIVHTINSTTPIFIFILDYFINSITINKLQFSFLLCGVLGILLTINDELFTRILLKDYEITSEFKNYINQDPASAAIASALFTGVIFVFAYAILRVRVLINISHLQTNFHLGTMFVFSAAFMYPFRVVNPMPIYKIVISIFTTGLVMAAAQMLITPALRLNRNTGALNSCQFISIVVSYAISYIRYNQIPNTIELLGLLFIIFGVLGVVHCADKTLPVNQLAAVLGNAQTFSSSKVIQ